MKHLIAFALTLWLTSGCSVNPVTGQNELSLLSTADEVAIGEKNYSPSLQTQGGIYSVDLELQRYVSDVGNRLAAVSDNTKLPYEFSIVNSSVPNAWALPGGKIAINRGLLLHLNDEAQLAAVLAHEIVHAAARHGAAQQSRDTLIKIGLAGIQASNKGQAHQKYTEMASSLGVRAWLAKYGRDDELESDRYAMQYMARAGYQPLAAVELQQTFLALSRDKRGAEETLFSDLFSSHPPSQQRVQANQMTARSLVSGARFKQRFDTAIAGLVADTDAYKASRRAKLALSKNDPQAALKLLDNAVAIQPGESNFWRLRGDAWVSLKNFDNAELAYSTAISKNSSYYLSYLRRGELLYGRGEIGRGLSDIQTSYDYLPTAKASYYLGISAQQRGDLRLAERYLSAATKARGDLSVRAQWALTSLRLTTSPGRFFSLDLGVSERGLLRVRLENISQFVLQATQLQVTDLSKHSREVIIPIKVLLLPGASDVVETAIGPVLAPQLSSRFQVEVLAATALEEPFRSTTEQLLR